MPCQAQQAKCLLCHFNGINVYSFLEIKIVSWQKSLVSVPRGFGGKKQTTNTGGQLKWGIVFYQSCFAMSVNVFFY